MSHAKRTRASKAKGVPKGRPNAIDQLVGRNLRKFREAKGWSQTRLGKALGTTFQQVQKYENGTNRISPGKLYIAAKALGVELREFFEGAEELYKEELYKILTKH